MVGVEGGCHPEFIKEILIWGEVGISKLDSHDLVHAEDGHVSQDYVLQLHAL